MKNRKGITVVALLFVVLCASCAGPRRIAGTAAGAVGGAARGGVSGGKEGAIGAVVGAALGAIGGAVIGHDSHDSGEGAGVGMVAGGVIGYLAGKFVQGWLGYGLPPGKHLYGPLTLEQYQELRNVLTALNEKLDTVNKRTDRIETSLGQLHKEVDDLPTREDLATMLEEELRALDTISGVSPPREGTAEEIERERLREEGKYRLREEPNLRDIYFSFDRSDILSAAGRILEINAQWLKINPGVKIIIEGHCDERGTGEYNLALGERRARSTYNYLISLGVPRSQIHGIMSWGEERPFDPSHTEQAWAKNRRAHFQVRESREFMPGRRIRPQAGPSSKKMRTPREKEPPYAFAGKGVEKEEAETGY